MPSYEFHCKACGHTLIEHQSIDSEPQVPGCTLCNKPMTRIYSAPAVTFNGTGWGKD